MRSYTDLTLVYKINAAAAAAAKSHQLCLTLCSLIDGSPPGFSIPEILQARILEWVAISFSNAWEWKVKVKSLSRVQLFKAPWTVAHQPPLSMWFSRQEYWSGLWLPSLIRYIRGINYLNWKSVSKYTWILNINIYVCVYIYIYISIIHIYMHA